MWKKENAIPVYDYACQCGWQDELLKPVGTDTLECPACKAPAARIWLARGSAVAEVTWPGGKTFENLGHDPVTLYSPAELRAECAARGLKQYVRHQPEKGSDKSPHTVRWVSSPTISEEDRIAHWRQEEAKLQAKLKGTPSEL